VPGEGDLSRGGRAARRGDQGAWDALVARYASLVWAVARGHGLPYAAATDVAHTTWLRLVESLDDAPDDAIGEWVSALARAESLQALRWVDPRPDRRLHPSAAVWAAVAGLPHRCQLALRLVAVDPPPDAHELAASLDVTPDAAQALVADALQRLAAAMRDTANQGET
jgi:DNA-directed RNA polymerase specialized sigma24 family protein